jgi:hypothetical protein
VEEGERPRELQQLHGPTAQQFVARRVEHVRAVGDRINGASMTSMDSPASAVNNAMWIARSAAGEHAVRVGSAVAVTGPLSIVAVIGLHTIASARLDVESSHRHVSFRPGAELLKVGS